MKRSLAVFCGLLALGLGALGDEYIETWFTGTPDAGLTLQVQTGFLEEFWWDNLWFDTHINLYLDIGGPNDTWDCLIGFRVGDRKHFLAGGALYKPEEGWGFLVHFRVPFNLPVEFDPKPVVLD